MNRARLTFAATLIGVSITAGTALAQATQAPPLTPLLTGKKFTAPLRGQAEVEYTTPITKRDGANVVTKIQVKNISAAPIARLSIDETWYDNAGAAGNIVAGGKGVINGMLQPGEVQTITIETPYSKAMKANQFAFTHANGSVKPKRVAKLDAGTSKEPAAETASDKTSAKTAKKKK